MVDTGDMKKRINADDELVTKGYLKDQFEKFGREVDEKAREYRDEVLSKMDTVIAELEQIREDQVFMKHDVQGREQGITKLENA